MGRLATATQNQCGFPGGSKTKVIQLKHAKCINESTCFLFRLLNICNYRVLSTKKVGDVAANIDTRSTSSAWLSKTHIFACKQYLKLAHVALQKRCVTAETRLSIGFRFLILRDSQEPPWSPEVRASPGKSYSKAVEKSAVFAQDRF